MIFEILAELSFGGEYLEGDHTQEQGSEKLCGIGYAIWSVPISPWFIPEQQTPEHPVGVLRDPYGDEVGLGRWVSGHEIRSQDHHCRRAYLSLIMAPDGMIRPAICSETFIAGDLVSTPITTGHFFVATETAEIGPNGFTLEEGLMYAFFPYQQPDRFEVLWAANNFGGDPIPV